MSENSNSLTSRLLDHGAFPHPVESTELVETHISWVILTGDFAYKIKKPVKFDFLDYSTMAMRKKYCHRELAHNSRFSSELYIGVVPIRESNGNMSVDSETVQNDSPDDTDDIIEYAVKMHQFPARALLAEQISRTCPEPDEVDDFARNIAGFHDTIEIASRDLKSAMPESICEMSGENFSEMEKFLQDDSADARLLKRLSAWSDDQCQRLAPLFRTRLKSGRVRRCHGDLHLNNIVRMNGRLSAFDGIEFNEDLQWIDVLSEACFTAMDLMAYGRSDLGWLFLSKYLEYSGDYEGMGVIRYYLVYRAMVRAKVSALKGEHGISPEWRKKLNTAGTLVDSVSPSLTITHGFSASGKSTAAMKIVQTRGGVCIRSDVERKRLHEQSPEKDKYGTDMTDRVYDRLLNYAGLAIDSGLPVIIDATFLKHRHREMFEQLAKDKNVNYKIVDCCASSEESGKRLQMRGADDVSDATPDVISMQMKSHDPLIKHELDYVQSCHS